MRWTVMERGVIRWLWWQCWELELWDPLVSVVGVVAELVVSRRWPVEVVVAVEAKVV